MAIIYSYPQGSSALQNDRLIITRVGGEENEITTKQLTLGQVVDLVPDNTLQEVLNAGNTATQSINLTGQIVSTSLTTDNAFVLNNLNVDSDLAVDGFSDFNEAGFNGDVTFFNPAEFQDNVLVPEIQFANPATSGEKLLKWNDTDGTLDLSLKGGNVTLQIGQEQVIRVVNGTGADLLEAQYRVVKVIGAQGQRLQVGLAQANSDINSATTIGLVTETIVNNQEGFITTEGTINKVNTTGSLQGETWSDGDVLYLSATIPGAITNVKPITPAHLVVVGFVEYAHASNGKIYVKVDNGYELDELHDVLITNPTENELLAYNATLGFWENVNADATPTAGSTNVVESGGVYDFVENKRANSIELGNEDFATSDQVFKESEKVTDTINPQPTNIYEYNDVNVSSQVTAIDLVSLTAGVKYTIEASTDDILTSAGMSFYFSPPLAEIINFPDGTDFSAGVSFTFIPEVDGTLKYRVWDIDINTLLKVYSIEYQSNVINQVTTNQNNIESVISEATVYGFEDFTTDTTGVFNSFLCGDFAGKTMNVEYKANYTGWFRIYGYTESSFSVIAEYENTDFTSGIEFSLAIPSDVVELKFRTHLSGAIIEYLRLNTPITQSIGVFNQNRWQNKKLGLYGDSITAISNDDYIAPYSDISTWGALVGYYLQLNSVYGRGIGGQKYNFGTNGGSVAFLESTGILNSRNDSYNYDDYSGNITVPSGTTPVRGAYSSWIRIINSFPVSIKDTIDAVFVMGGTNDTNDATDATFIPSDTTDPEWALSTEYADYNGDYNLTTLKGGVASTVMKLQAWMPQAIIIIGTPLSGRGSTGLINTTLITDEYNKSINIREIANIMALPIVDVNASCGINGLNRIDYITDGVHPYSSEGNKMLARTVIGGLKVILPKI